MSIIEDAYIKAGGRAVVRAKLGVSKQTLSDWKRKAHVPAKHAANLEALSGIPREQLSPEHKWVKRSRKAA